VREVLAQKLRVFCRHVAGAPDDFERVVVHQERLNKVLLVPEMMILEYVRFKVVEWKLNVVDVDDYPFGKSRQNLEHFEVDVAVELRDVTRIDKKYITVTQLVKRREIDILDFASYERETVVR